MSPAGNAPDTRPRGWSRAWNTAFVAFAALALLAAFLATRYYLVVIQERMYSEVMLYFEYASNGVDLGLVPYREIPLEYPPGAYWLICIPRWLDAERIPREALEQDGHLRWWQRYVAIYYGMLLAADIAALLLVVGNVARRHPQRVHWAAWGYVLTTALLAHVLYERLDLLLAALLAAWAWCWSQLDDGTWTNWLWAPLAYAAVGLGISYKLIPVVIVPLLVWADLMAWRRAGDRSLLASWPILLITTVGPFAWIWQQAGNDTWKLFAYHAQRGLQVESIPATLLYVSSTWTEPVRLVHGFGAWNLEGSGDGWLLTAANLLLMGTLAALGLIALQKGRAFDRRSAGRLAMLAILWAVVWAKVLSPQYLIWALPIALLLGADVLRRGWYPLLIALALVVAALTTWVFPYHYFSSFNAWAVVPDLHPAAMAVVVARNVLLAAMVVWLSVATGLHDRSSAADDP